MVRNVIALFALFILSATFGTAQTPVKASLLAGEVASITDKVIVLTTATGSLEVILNDKTEYKKMSPEKPSVTTATPIALTDISVGDKVLASGFPAADGKSLPARTIYVLNKADISQKHAKEAEEWRVRGIKGKIIAVNPQTNQFTVEVANLTGTSQVTVTPKAEAKFKRYAPDSVKYEEALDSSLAELKNGDMIRALGDKSSDGLALSAEQVVSGAFQTIAGTIKSVDAEKNEVVIKDLVTNKDVTVAVIDTSVVKRYPAEMAERMAFQMGGPSGGPRPLALPARAADRLAVSQDARS
jgi:hypothetical protein